MRKILLIIIVGLFLNTGFSQEKEDLPIEGVEVIKNFDARLKDAIKVDLKPSIPPSKDNPHQYQYKVTTTDVSIDYPAPSIRPLSMKKEELPANHNGFLKVGVGTPSLVLVDFGYKLVDKENLSLGLTAYHNQAKKDDFQRHADTEIKALGEYKINESNALKVTASYGIRDINFYGFAQQTSDPYVPDDVDRKYRLLKFSGQFSNTNYDKSNGFDIHLTPYRLSLSDLDNHETGLEFKSHFYRKINKRFQFRTDIDAGISGYKNNDITRDLGYYSFAPSFRVLGNKIHLDLGVRLSSAEGQFEIFPEINIDFEVVEDKFVFFAGASGAHEANSILNISNYSPFIHGQLDSLVFTTEKKYYGGLKGQIGMLKFNGEAGYKDLLNQALFLTDYSDFKRPLDVLYDDVNIFYVNGSLELLFNKFITIHGKVTQNFYDTNNEDEAWHLPNLELMGGISYNTLDKKLTLSSELHFASSVRYLDFEGNKDRLNNLVDLNFGIHYKLLKKIHVFATANNVLNVKYERWKRYPSYGAGIMAGVKVLF